MANSSAGPRSKGKDVKCKNRNPLVSSQSSSGFWHGNARRRCLLLSRWSWLCCSRIFCRVLCWASSQATDFNISRQLVWSSIPLLSSRSSDRISRRSSGIILMGGRCWDFRLEKQCSFNAKWPGLNQCFGWRIRSPRQSTLSQQILDYSQMRPGELRIHRESSLLISSIISSLRTHRRDPYPAAARPSQFLQNN